MKSMQPKIGDTLWGVWEHRYYNEKRLVELEYVVYPVKITRFFKKTWQEFPLIYVGDELPQILGCANVRTEYT